MAELQRVHRFCDHDVEGVNWRPTRFADEVPSSRVCALCSTIPRSAVLLPCSHVMCQSCYAAISQGCGGRCPLDQEQFREAQCVNYDFLTKNGNALKVYCWNETRGCEYEGAVEDMLRHFENKCIFHAVECSRCGEAVCHKELATHYMAGCSSRVSLARIENTSSKSRPQTLQDIKDSPEEVKTLSRKPNQDQRMPTIQSQTNELTELLSSQESRSVEITSETGATENAETVQRTAASSSTVSQEPTTRRNPEVEASTLSTSFTTEMESQKCEVFSSIPAVVLKRMRRTSTQDYPQHAIEYFRPSKSTCDLKLTNQLSTTSTWREVLGSVKYVVTIDSSKSTALNWGTNSCTITVLHTMDSYLTIRVKDISLSGDRTLVVYVDFFGMQVGSRSKTPCFSVFAFDRTRRFLCALDPRDWPCRCEDARHERVHYHGLFQIELDDLRHTGCLHQKRLELEINLTNEKRRW